MSFFNYSMIVQESGRIHIKCPFGCGIEFSYDHITRHKWWCKSIKTMTQEQIHDAETTLASNVKDFRNQIKETKRRQKSQGYVYNICNKCGNRYHKQHPGEHKKK